jgi:hypothetical protein
MKMKIISNSILPLKGFVAMTVWPFVFVRREWAGKLSRATMRHEEIHGEQQKEMLTLGLVAASAMVVLGFEWWSLLTLPLFYIWYGFEWLAKWIYYRDAYTAYKNVSFEREAFANQRHVGYIDKRVPFAWTSYIRASW